jgi:CRP-like cAMP-binding protein
VGGPSLRIPVAKLRAAIDERPTLHQHLLRYVHLFNVQIAHTGLSHAGLSHGGYTVATRLARWLLMCHDRLDGDDLPLVHEFIALMLGVRRPGVTEHLNLLEGVKAIRAKRGLITVLDRGKLEEAAGDSYGVPEAEYEKLVGPFRKRPRSAE